MHYQSDYGYAVGSIEYIDHSVCLRKAAFCREGMARYPELRSKFFSHWRAWMNMAAWYRGVR